MHEQADRAALSRHRIYEPQEARRGALIIAPSPGPAPELARVCEVFAEEGYEVLVVEDAGGGESLEAEFVRCAELLEGPVCLLGFSDAAGAAFAAVHGASSPFAALALFDGPDLEVLGAGSRRVPMLIHLSRDDARLPAMLSAAEGHPEPAFRVFAAAAPTGFALEPGHGDARNLAFLRVRQHFHQALAGRERGA